MFQTHGWAFLSLISGLMITVLSLTLVSPGTGQIAGCLLGAGLCVLSGGLYAMRSKDATRQSTATDDESK